MSDNVMVTKLIDEAKKIVSDVETLRNRNGSDFNIFSVGQMKNLLLVDPVKMVSMTILRNVNLKKYLGAT